MSALTFAPVAAPLRTLTDDILSASSLESLLDDYTDAESDREREGILGRALELWFRAGCEGELSGCVEDVAWELREGELE